MPSIIESLQNAANRLDAAVTAVLGLRGELQTIRDDAATRTATTINNFIARPPIQIMFCDPIDGNDASDGKTLAAPKKTIESIVAGIGISATTIVLLNDAVMRQRLDCYASLSISGAQRNNTARGYADFKRTLTFLGSAINSPFATGETFGSGFFFSGPNVTCTFINFRLPVQAAGQTYPAHLYSANGTNFSLREGTLLVDGDAAGQLVGVTLSRSNVFSNLALGSGAAGHLFQNVPAGANPNNQFAYASNVTSA